MASKRRSNRLKKLPNKDYTEDAQHKKEMNLSEILPKGTIVSIRNPNKYQKSYPYLMILDIEGLRDGVFIFVGPFWELLARLSFRVRHIDHHHLLKCNELKYVLSPGFVSLDTAVYQAADFKDLHIMLLQNKLQNVDKKINKLTHTIDYSATSVIGKWLKSICSSLHNRSYMNGKMMVKIETIPLPLFLKKIKISTEAQIKAIWNVEGKKPERKFQFDFADKQIDKWFETKYVNRTSQKGLDTVRFKPYTMVFVYHEKKVQMEANYFIKRKVGNGRWTKTS